MKCMYCGCEDSKVIDSRSTDDGKSIRRRRECIACGKRFTTFETIETVPFLVISGTAPDKYTTVPRSRTAYSVLARSVPYLWRR